MLRPMRTVMLLAVWFIFLLFVILLPGYFEMYITLLLGLLLLLLAFILIDVMVQIMFD